MRRRPMFNVRQERTLAIDGDIIRSMPSDTASAADTANKVVRTHVPPHGSTKERPADVNRGTASLRGVCRPPSTSRA